MDSTFAAMAYFPLSSFPASQMMNLAATVPVALRIFNAVLIVGTSFLASDISAYIG
jgi:hypothetical protein